MLKSRMWEIHKSGSERGVKLFYKAEYCGTPQSKERRNGEYKVCLNERALRLLDQDVTWKSGCFSALKRGVFTSVTSLISSFIVKASIIKHYIGQGGLKKWKSYEQSAASISYTFKLTYKTEENAINI